MADDVRERLVQTLSRLQPQRPDVDGARAAAVLIPIVAAPEPELIFTVRTDTVRSHKGQISFPGGSVDDSDESPREAALRETAEEIGLDAAAVELIGELDSFPTFVSGYVVTPFVGWLDAQPRLEPNPAEVAAILQVPLASLGNDIRRDPGFSHGGRTYPTEAWVWNDHVIWGVTARIVRQLLDVLGDAGLVERPSGDGSWFLPSVS